MQREHSAKSGKLKDGDCWKRIFTQARRSSSEALRAMRVIIAGGGTGGHLFPGIAIAEAFMAKDSDNRVLFVSTGKPFELSVLSKKGFAHKRITSEGIKGRGFFRQIRSMLKIPKGIFESIRIIKEFRPDIVVGVGSYASGPVAMGAWLLGIKIVLHEQNILPGITNRILSRLADRIYVSFKNTKWGLSPKKVHITGNPVRKEILQSARDQKSDDLEDSEQMRRLSILVIGGSQGAHSINMAVMDAIKHIKEKTRFFFVHQTGSNDETMVKNTYMKHGICCTVQSFFIDMAQQYKKADLVICRAGATTVAEVTATGKGVIFIPYPFAADNHQALNARTLADAGAAEMILQKDLSGIILAERIEYYASNPEALYKMASRAKNFGRPNAAENIVDDCYRLVSSSNR